VADQGQITALRFNPNLRLPGDDGLLWVNGPPAA